MIELFLLPWTPQQAGTMEGKLFALKSELASLHEVKQKSLFLMDIESFAASKNMEVFGCLEENLDFVHVSR